MNYITFGVNIVHSSHTRIPFMGRFGGPDSIVPAPLDTCACRGENRELLASMCSIRTNYKHIMYYTYTVYTVLHYSTRYFLSLRCYNIVCTQHPDTLMMQDKCYYCGARASSQNATSRGPRGFGI